jgi:hypothetical protein
MASPLSDISFGFLYVLLGVLALCVIPISVYIAIGRVCIGLVGVCNFVRDELVEVKAQFGDWWRSFVLQWKLSRNKRARQRGIRRMVSTRVWDVFRLLDLDHHEDIQELVAGERYIRASVVYSRQCRVALKYPDHSEANEKIAVDWIAKHLPEDMPFSVKFRIIPLAAKLTFVCSARELAAEEYFVLLKPLTRTA